MFYIFANQLLSAKGGMATVDVVEVVNIEVLAIDDQGIHRLI